jgi:hypothetical protein
MRSSGQLPVEERGLNIGHWSPVTCLDAGDVPALEPLAFPVDAGPASQVRSRRPRPRYGRKFQRLDRDRNQSHRSPAGSR